MQIITVPAGPLRANSYLLTENGRDAVLIDCGGSEALAQARRRGLQVAYVLLTHGHFDHIGGCAFLEAGPDLGLAMGLSVPPFTVDFTFRDGDVLDLCGIRFAVIASPGHTPGGVCFRAGQALFTGDTLFLESVGRTDFPGGSAGQLRQSVRRLLAIEGDLAVYPGHDDPTSLAHERRYNPFA